MVLKRFLSTIIYLILFVTLIWIIVCFFGINKVDNTDREAIISAIVALFVFGAGLLAQMFGNKISQYKKDLQLKRIFIVNLRTILEGLKLQTENYIEVIKTIKSHTPENVMLSSYAELDYLEINNFASEDLFRVFIDYLKGDEKSKIATLENVRKQLRFIENSRDMITSGFEKLYDAIHIHSNNVLDGISDLGKFFDEEATRLFHTNADINSDHWFKGFAELWGKTTTLLKISDETFTDYEKLGSEIIPKFFEFAKDNMKDPRTPLISAAVSKANIAIYQRKDTIINLIKFVDFHLTKYNEAKNTIEKTILAYDK